MKLEEVETFISEELFEEILQESDNDAAQTMEDAHEEISLLAAAMNRGDFGILINKPNRVLTSTDIFQIKRKLSDILRNNPIIAGSNISAGKDGRENLRILGRRVAAGLEVFGMSAITILFSKLAVGLSFTGIGGIAAAGAAAVTGALTASSYKNLRELNQVSRVLNIVDSIGDLDKEVNYNRSVFKRIVDKFKGKTDEQIKAESRRKLKRSSQQLQKNLEKAIGNLPDTIRYIDSDGIEKDLPIHELFEL